MQNSRHIEFRVYDKRFKEFRSWGFIDNIFVSPPTGSMSIEECFKLSQQFTGILDAKDKKIFEGDLHREEVEFEEGDVRHYYVCVYIKELACFSFISIEEYREYIEYQMPFNQVFENDKPYTLDTDEMNKYHICGNVFDNPNLLQGDDGSDLDLEKED